METSIKQIFLKDIEESIEVNNQDIQIEQESLSWIKEKIALYSNVERRLGHSIDDESLRKYIQHRLMNWKEIESKSNEAIQKSKENIEKLKIAQKNIEARKDDLSA